MRDDTTTQPVVFKDLFGKPVVARFDQPDSSSDGGAVLLKACDDRLELTEAIAACVADARQPGKVIHRFHDLVRQRVFGIACGYEDCNDAERLAEDPMQKLLVDRDPIAGGTLASQSTLSRFENALGPKALMRMGNALADTVIARHRKRLKGRVKRITVELDPTDDPTHGAQQLTFFNGHYDTWCYLPVAGFVQFDAEPEQYLFAYLLRPGNADEKLGAIGLLRRILARLRAAFPKARVLVRLDGGFAGPGMFDYLEAERVDYVVAMAGNAVLKRQAEPLMKKARRLSRRSQQTGHLYGECQYAAGSWSRKRRVIIKAEVVRLGDRAPKDNPRFVVTSLSAAEWDPRALYEDLYCARGDMENRIKEQQLYLFADRTSTATMRANQIRLYLSSVAYLLLHALRRLGLQGTTLARAQCHTLRLKLLKIGAQIRVTARKVWVSLASGSPHAGLFARAYANLRALPLRA